MPSNVSLTGLGTEQLTVSSTSIGFASIPANAVRAYVRVRGANIFVENDGTAASTSAGLRVDDGSFIDLTDARYVLLSDFRFIRAVSTDATLDIMYYN